MAALAKSAPKAVVAVRLTNRWAYFDCDPDLHAAIKEHFRFQKPGYRFAPSYVDGSWDGWTHLFQRGRVATGLFLERCEALGSNFSLAVSDERKTPQFRAAKASDRGYQNDAVGAMIAASGCGGLLLSATGTGKTRFAGMYFARLIGSGLFVVDELGLLEQSRRAIADTLGEEVGVVGKSEFRPKRITAATIQTLARHRETPAFRKWFRSLEAVMIDELHVQMGKRNFDVVRSIKPKAVFGLTATLEMEKPWIRLPAIALCGPVVFDYGIKQGVEEGYLARGVVCRLHFVDPLCGVAPGYWSDGFRERGAERVKERIFVPPGSPDAQYRYHVCLNAARNDCVEKIAREAVRRGRNTVVLVERKVHLRMISSRLRDLPHAALCGDDESEVRFAAMRAMDAGKLNLILASKIFAKGVDVRSVDCIVDATGLPSRNNALQRYGRGVRPDGSKVLLYFDVSDCGNPFARASKARWKALVETGSKIENLTWSGDASRIFDWILK